MLKETPFIDNLYSLTTIQEVDKNEKGHRDERVREAPTMTRADGRRLERNECHPAGGMELLYCCRRNGW